MSFSEFNTAVLGDLVTIKGGKRLPKGASLISEKNSHPYIKVKDMNGGKKVRLSKTFEYVDDETQKSIKNYIVNKNDIIISIVGTIGLVSVIDDSLDNANLTENCVKLINLTNVDKDYLYYFLTSDTGQNEMRKGTVGSTQPKLPIYNIKKIELPLPHLYIQKTIAHILSTLDDKIEVNNQINITLENMAQAIFKQWFVDFDFPNEDGEPYKTSGGELVESELGMIPKGWEVKELGEIIDIHDSKRIPLSKNEREKREKIYPYYGAASLMDYVDEFIFDGTYVLLGEDGTVVNEDGSPVLQYVWGKFWVNNHAHVLSGKKGISTNFLYILLSNLNVSGAITGAVQLKINQKNLKEMKIIMPNDMKLVSQFSDIVDKSFEKIRVKRDENKNLVLLRDSLLPKLMSGEIRVPLDEEGDAS